MVFCTGAFCILLALILVQAMIKDVPTEIPVKEGHSFQIIDRHLLNAGILGASLATFMMAGAFSMMTPLETEFNARLHETALDFSIAFSALMVSRLVLQIPLGRLSDRYGRKLFIIAGLILTAFSTALLGEARTTVQLIWLRVIQGVGAAGIAAPAFALAADLAKPGGEGRQMSIITMGFGLGIALGPLIAGLLAVVDFDLPFVFVGLMVIGAAGVIFHSVPETVQHKPKR
jgi:MFS family permease